MRCVKNVDCGGKDGKKEALHSLKIDFIKFCLI